MAATDDQNTSRINYQCQHNMQDFRDYPDKSGIILSVLDQMTNSSGYVLIIWLLLIHNLALIRKIYEKQKSEITSHTVNRKCNKIRTHLKVSVNLPLVKHIG